MYQQQNILWTKIYLQLDQTPSSRNDSFMGLVLPDLDNMESNTFGDV